MFQKSWIIKKAQEYAVNLRSQINFKNNNQKLFKNNPNL